MAIPNTYLSAPSKISGYFKKLQDGQAPDKFTLQHLRDIGLTSTNDRPLIRLLKALGFLSSEGAPTKNYLDYRDESQAKKVLGRAIKTAYADLFVIKSNPKDSDKEVLAGKFKSVHNCSQDLANRMASTFLALLKISDIKEETRAKKTTEPIEKDVEKPEEESSVVQEKPAQMGTVYPNLNYNIQIHLPATKDVEVYNSIFKSIKEHLID